MVVSVTVITWVVSMPELGMSVIISVGSIALPVGISVIELTPQALKVKVDAGLVVPEVVIPGIV